MAEREAVPRLPTSGQIIGALVTRLGIRHPVLQGRSARRYFSGDPEDLVTESTRMEIIAAIAEVLTESGLINSPQAGEDDYLLAPTLASMLQWHADNWDLQRSFLRRRMTKVLPSKLPKVWRAFVRLAVIDLSLRIAAHLHLSGSLPTVLNLLNWASRTGRGDFLNVKRQNASLSLEDLVEEVGVDDNTVDAWMYRGARPSNDNLANLACILADKIEGSNPSDIALELRSLYWVSDVAALLAEHAGAEAVDDAIGRLHRYADAAYHIIEEQFPAEDRVENLTVLADLGVGARLAEPLLTALIDEEPDEDWREDLRSTGIGWVRRVLSANLNALLAEVDYLLEKTEGHILEDWDENNAEAFAHYRRSLELEMQGKLPEALAELETAARLDPLEPVSHFALGSVKTGLGIGRDDKALVQQGLEALWLAVALNPQWIPPWAEIGSTLLHTERPAEAVDHLLDLKPECGPRDHHYYSTLGAAFWRVDRLHEALEAFEAALELDPEETANLLAASELAMLTGDVNKQKRYLRRARHFGAEEGTENLWELLREFGKKDQDDAGTAEHDRTISVMDAVIRLNPEDDYAYMRRGLAYYSKGEDDLALSDLDTVLRLNPDHAGAYVLRGSIFGHRKQWGRLVDDMTELIRLRPESAMAYYKRGLAFGEQDLSDEAITDLGEAIRLDPNHADAYRGRGDGLRYRGEYDRAIEDFDTALQLDPSSAAAHLGRGGAYRMKGEPGRAITDYDAAIRLNPRDPLAYRFRGGANIAEKNYDQAVADCTRALSLGPDDPVAYFTRGNAHLFSGRLEPALRDFNSAVVLDPSSGRCTYGRGLVRQLMADEEGAAEDYRRARDLGYGDQGPECEA